MKKGVGYGEAFNHAPDPSRSSTPSVPPTVVLFKAVSNILLRYTNFGQNSNYFGGSAGVSAAFAAAAAALACSALKGSNTCNSKELFNRRWG